MKKIKNVKVKPKFALLLKVVCFILCILLGSFIFYSKQISQLTSLNYSKRASRKILFSRNKDFVLGVGENKTLNKAFESDDFDEKYLDNYSKIKYVNHTDLIKNINSLLKIGYSNSDINLIITHGTNDDVREFAKRDKVKYLEEFYTLDYAKINNYDTIESEVADVFIVLCSICNKLNICLFSSLKEKEKENITRKWN